VLINGRLRVLHLKALTNLLLPILLCSEATFPCGDRIMLPQVQS